MSRVEGTQGRAQQLREPPGKGKAVAKEETMHTGCSPKGTAKMEQNARHCKFSHDAVACRAEGS